MYRVFLVVFGIGGLTVALMAANRHRDTRAVDVDWRVVQRPPRLIVAESPSRGLIVQTVTAPGTVTPIEEADIASQVVGRVVCVAVKDGDRVRKGDLLVRLDAIDAKARLESAEARIARAKASIVQAQAEVERANRDVGHTSKLAGRGAAATDELANARTALAKANASLEIARAERAEAEASRILSLQDLTRTEIRAPIDGVVTGLNVAVGEVAIAGTVNLPGALMMTVTDFAKLWIRAEVDEADIRMVRPGQPARIFLQSDPSTPIAGVAEQVLPKGVKSDEVVSFETRVRVVGAPAGLQPGMTATVELEVRRAEGALGIPVQAVVHRRRKDLPDSPAVREWGRRHPRRPGASAREAESQYVKIVFAIEDGVARARPVETGLSDEQRVEVVGGLEPSQRVVVGPFRELDELRDGDPVREAAPGEGTARGGRR